MRAIASIEIPDDQSQRFTAHDQLEAMNSAKLLTETFIEDTPEQPDVIIHIGYGHNTGDVPTLNLPESDRTLVFVPAIFGSADPEQQLEILAGASSTSKAERANARDQLEQNLPSPADALYWHELLGSLALINPEFALLPDYRSASSANELAMLISQDRGAEMAEYIASIASGYFTEHTETIGEYATQIIWFKNLLMHYSQKINHRLNSDPNPQQALAFVPPGLIGLPHHMNGLADTRTEQRSLDLGLPKLHRTLGKLVTGPEAKLALAPIVECLAIDYRQSSDLSLYITMQMLFWQIWRNRRLSDSDNLSAYESFDTLPSGSLFDQTYSFYKDVLPERPAIPNVSEVINRLYEQYGWEIYPLPT